MSPAASQPRRRGPRTDAQRNNERILRAAARVLAEDPRATIQRLADEAGVVRLTVYRRYANREALRRAIFEAAAAEAHQAIANALALDRDPVACLRAIIIEMAAIAQRYPLLSVGTDLQPLPGQPRRPPPPPASKATQQALLDLVRSGQRQGALRPTCLPSFCPRPSWARFASRCGWRAVSAPTPTWSGPRSPTCCWTGS